MYWKIIFTVLLALHYSVGSKIDTKEKHINIKKPLDFETSHKIVGFDSKSLEDEDSAADDYTQSSAGAYLTTTGASIIGIKESNVKERSVPIERGSKTQNLETAPSEQKHHSRIQIKKGPNGEDYEYEYIYYYYDEDEPITNDFKDSEKKSESKKDDDVTANQQASASKTRNRYSSIERNGSNSPTVQEHNEVIPEGRSNGRSRSRTAPEDKVSEERLPVSTRFPPRSRQITTTISPSSETLTTEDRGRTSVRRPSLELVDSASFKTHAGDASVSQYKDADNQHNRENAGAEKINTKIETKFADHEIVTENTIQQTTEESTEDSVAATSMDKVAFDLYAYLASEDLNSKDQPTTETATEEMDTQSTTLQEEGETTVVITTVKEPATTETTTPETTTTELTTTALPAGRNRFRLRPGSRLNGKTTTTTTTTTAKPEPSLEKVKSRFSSGGLRPSFGRGRTTAPTSSVPVDEPKANVEETKPLAHAKGRNRFNLRGRTTTVAPQDDSDVEKEVTTKSAVSTQSRFKSNFNARTRGRPTTENKQQKPGDEKQDQEHEEPAVVPKSIRRPTLTNKFVVGRSKTAPETHKEEKLADSEHNASEEEAASETTTATSSLNKIRQRPRLQVTAQKPNPAVKNPFVVNRRTNPLLSRKKILNQATAEEETENTEEKTEHSEEKVELDAQTESEKVEEDKSEKPETVSETPKGLNGLLAGRRRLVGRKPGTI